MYRSNIQNSTVFYNRNLSILREKVSQDMYLKTSLFNINNRKPSYGINRNIYMLYIANNKSGSRQGSRKGSKYGSKMNTVNGSRPGSKQGSRQGSRNGSRCQSPSASQSYSHGYTQTMPNKSPKRNIIYKYKLRKDTYLEGLQNQKREKQKAIDLDNLRLKNRIKRASSPYSRKCFEKDGFIDAKRSQLRQQIRTNAELRKQEKKVQSELPKIFIRSAYKGKKYY
ncbi:MAG: hypothetical protein MJ252_27770 [archaeon]|nr:hypothetical protein [archaeon]